MSSSPHCIYCGDYVHHGPVICHHCMETHNTEKLMGDLYDLADNLRELAGIPDKEITEIQVHLYQGRQWRVTVRPSFLGINAKKTVCLTRGFSGPSLTKALENAIYHTKEEIALVNYPALKDGACNCALTSALHLAG